MRRLQVYWLYILILACGTVAVGQEVSPFSAQPGGQLFATGSGRVFVMDQQGKVTWEYKVAGNPTDGWVLPNGNILYGDGKTVTEVTRDKKVVFEFRSATGKGDATYGCQRLENGNTLIGENATGNIYEVDAQGKIVFTLKALTIKEGHHHNQRMVRKLANGNYLVCHSGSSLVREYKPDGSVALEIKTKALAFAAIRTPQNTTLISTLNQITEYDAQGKETWEFCSAKDAPGTVIKNLTGIHLLENGNIVAGCYSAYDKEKKGTGMLEIRRDKTIAWLFHSPETAGSMMAVQMLDPTGQALKGPCQR